MAYLVTVDCLITWFAATPASNLPVPWLRGLSFAHMSDEPGLAEPVSHPVIAPGFAEGLYHPNASIEIRFQGGVYQADLGVELFGERRSARLLVPPDAQIPFMLYVSQGTLGFENAGQAVVFQGVFAAGPDTLLEFPIGKMRISGKPFK